MIVTEEKIPAPERFKDLFLRSQEILSNGESGLVNRNREAAMNAFLRMGIPTFKTENYKYTDLTNLFQHENFRRVLSPDHFDVDLKEVFSCDVPQFDTHLVMTINGWFYESPDQSALPQGTVIKSFKKAVSENRPLVEKYYGEIADQEADPLTALNSAFAQDGIFIYIPDNAVLTKPIQIINLLRSNDDLYATQRNLIIAGKNSRVNVIFCDHTLTPQNYISNVVTEFEAGDDAVVDIYTIQNHHNKSANLSGLFIRLGQNSHLVSNVISLHGGIIRNNLGVTFNGENGEAKVCGLALTDKNQHVDNFTTIQHAKPHCISNQLYKNILDDSASGAFTGRIYVAPHAVKTQAYQRNNNVLLTNTAKMNSKPQLVIDNDDVKCTHGATVGRINEEALFYLQARGIRESEARLMLMFAFAHEVLSEIKVDTLRERIDRLVDKRLRGEVSKCHLCAMDCIR